MWLVSPWSKRAKWWVTGITLGIPLLGILASLLLIFVSPKRQLSAVKDAQRRASVQEISTQARRFCLDMDRCPDSVLELQQKGYIGEIPVDPDTKVGYFYQVTSDGKDCLVKAQLSTKKDFSGSCSPDYTP